MKKQNKKKGFRALFFCLGLFFVQGIFLSKKLSAESYELSENFEDDGWSRGYVHRYAHHVNILTGVFLSRWDGLGEESSSQPFLDVSLSYAYHMKLFSKFSFFVGSSLGYAADLASSDPLLKRSLGRVFLPGFLTGLSCVFSTRTKMDLGANFSWSRSFGLTYDDIQYQYNMRTFPEVFLSFDYFFSPNWAVTASIRYRKEVSFLTGEDFKKSLGPIYESSRDSLGVLLGFTFNKL